MNPGRPSGCFSVARDDGAVLDGVVAGSGPVVVLCHCWTGTRSVWSPVADRLVERGHTVIRYDQRGHGRSTPGSAPVTLTRLGADLRAVLEVVDARDAVVAGHSLGGMVAQALAVEHPATVARRVRALVLVATAAAGVAGPPIRTAARLVADHRQVERLLAGRPGRALFRPVLGRALTGEHVAATRDAFLATPAAVRRSVLEAMCEMDLRHGLASISVPATVVVAGRDRLTPPRRGRAIAAAIPSARLVEVPRAGHMLPLEHPELITDLITDLVTDLAARARDAGEQVATQEGRPR